MKEISEELESFLKVLADSTRLEIIEILKSGESDSENLQKTLNKSQSTISQHLKSLTNAGIINFNREGAKKRYFIRDTDIQKILLDIKSFISRYNKEKIDSLVSREISDILH